MEELRAASNLIMTVLMLFTSIAWPPAASGAFGAFWTLVGIWGLISILFDDETPRGTPGIDVVQAYRVATEKKLEPGKR